MRAGEQQRRLVASRMDRRDHRDVDIARLVAEQRCGLLLAAGRDRIDVEVIGIAGKMRRDRRAASRLEAAVTAEMMMSASAHRVGGRGREPHADVFAGLP